MTPQTEANINEAIDWLQKTGGEIQSFASEQAPLYCREVVAWEFWGGVISGGAGILILTIGFIAAWKFVKWIKEDRGEPNARTIPAMLVAFFCFISGITLTSTGLPRAIKASVAPRLVIVEHLSGLRK